MLPRELVEAVLQPHLDVGHESTDFTVAEILARANYVSETSNGKLRLILHKVDYAFFQFPIHPLVCIGKYVIVIE